MTAMANWKSYVRGNTLEWLLEDNNPSVRYYALIELIDKKPDSKEVREAQSKIMTQGIVPKILKKQNPDGYWYDLFSFYLPKRKATLWQFYTLVDLATDVNDERIRKTCEYLLENSQHKASGAFSPNSYERLRKISKSPSPSERVLIKHLGAFSDDLKGGISAVIPCLTGQMLYSLIRCGYLDDPRIQKGIDWIAKYQRFDDGVHWFGSKPPRPWPYEREACWGKHTCHDGMVLALRALCEIPMTRRSEEVKRVIEQGSEHILKHHIYKRSHDLNQISKADWIKLGYPHSLDFLAVLLILAKLGCKDDRIQDAIDLLISKQNKNGRWIAEKPGYEQKGEESKWITLNALSSLKSYYP
jgi:hypothetical protein